MKVQCEQCGAAYSVADEKVAGRKLKQRCRKCGHAIVIDGSALEAAAPQAESFGVSVPPDTEAVWHIAVGDTTQGPYTLEELGQYYADGHIVLDTLVCRDGWNDWKQAGEVPELVAASRSSAAPAQAQRSRGPMVPQHVAQALGQQVAMGSDPFGEAPDSGAVPAARGGASSASLSPRVSAEEMATPGMQRDGTVQFSMDEIRALSAVSMTSIAPVAPTLPGRATNDDSGLIDMRALAVAEAEAAAAAAHAAQHPAPGGYRPYTPSQVGGLQAVSPLTFAQTASPSVGLDTRTKVFAGLAALGITLGAVVAVVWMQRGTQPTAVAMAAPQPAMQAGMLAAAAPPAAPEAAPAAAPAAEPAAPEPAAPAEEAVAAADPAPKAKARSRDGASSSHGSKRKAHAPAADADEIPTKSAAAAKSDAESVDDFITKKAPAKKGSPDIDDLLEGAISAKKAAPKETAPKEEAAAGGGLPQTPSRDDMKAALGVAKTKAAKCKGPGVATAEITVSGKSGRATGVTVSGVEGAAKSCVEKAVRSTSFPKFQKDSFEVKFPFKLAD